jgi:hypothetical protein
MPRRSTLALGIMLSAILALAVSSRIPSIIDVTIHEIAHSGNRNMFELRNNSNRSVIYEHFLGLGPHPVAYCQGKDGTIHICSRRVMENPDGQPWIEVGDLASRARVTFEANRGSGEIVGVKITVDDVEIFVWEQMHK